MSEQKTETYDAYGWQTNWKCPGCGHKHTKPHFAFENQIDKSKGINVIGRIKDKFSREGKDGENVTCEEFVNKHGTGPSQDDKTGHVSPLFCPHCGWEDELIYIDKYYHYESPRKFFKDKKTKEKEKKK